MHHRYAYLHGFASSPLSHKGVALQAAFAARGLSLLRPDLRAPSFEGLRITAAMDVLDGLGPGPWRLVGSSLGGYLAAYWASRHPAWVDRLLLLCPGFGLADRWPHILGREVFARWEADGFTVLPDATGRPARVGFGFIEDARRHPASPGVSCPTRIIHGARDEVVPIAVSREYARALPHVELVEVDDDHSLAGSIGRICDEALSWLAAGSSGPTGSAAGARRR